MTMPPDSPSGADDVLSLAAGFPPADPDTWADMAAAVVNRSRTDEDAVDGAGAVDALSSELPGGLRIDPIHWPQERSLGLPGAMPFTRGRGPRDPELPWHVCQLHDDPDATTSRRAVLEDLERGSAPSGCTSVTTASLPTTSWRSSRTSWSISPP
ncbi:methylmalonyl-CoA mutase family protein [Janibacter sp. DB-40]|uniref:methylmalonyl-CoA mutase family protein n=1 Tax=Janibacter sp. DB-40 TaxID=3028808 RepID=UPI002405B07F|nr:methylmalonyl-CoA mutase family protein [Janibacter sp. DB-40]